MRIEALILDMDGLMLDTEPLYRAAYQRAAAESGFALSDAIHSRLIGRNASDVEQLLLDEFGPGFPIEAFRRACHKLEATFVSDPPPKKPGLNELLALLDSMHVPKAVATSTRRNMAVPLLAATGLLDRFKVIAAGDEVTYRKPAPDLFLLAAQRLRINQTACLVLEDSELGVMAAHRAGMQVYMVPDLQASSPKTQRLADGVFDTLALVARHLEPVLRQQHCCD